MSLSRRECIALLAGVPLSALTGCGGSDGFSFGGELLAPDFQSGHRIRDGWRPNVSNDSQQVSVVVVGGGIAGLSAAWQLERLGISDFVVLELSASPGGTSLSGSHDGFQFPWGAHYVPQPMRENESLIELFEQMDVVEGRTESGEPIIREQYLCRDPEERVFADGGWTFGLYPIHGATMEDREQLQRFRGEMVALAHQRDGSGKRLFAIPAESGSDDSFVRALDGVSMETWLSRNGYDSERLLWLIDYCCRDDYGLPLDQTSAWAGLFYFASRIADDHEEPQPVITWPEGNGRIVDFLAQRAGDRLRCRHAVARIENQPGGVNVQAFDTAAATGVALNAKKVVFAVPQFMARHLIADWPKDRSTSSFRYGAWIVANVHLTGRPRESSGAMCWDNVIYESNSLGYVTSTHQLGMDHGPTVITWYYPLLAADPRISRNDLLQLRWEDWAAVAVADLRKAHEDIEPLISRMDIMRWGHAMIQPRVGFRWGGERESAAQPIGGVHFAGTDLSGIALMEEAFYWGVRAANEVASG